MRLYYILLYGERLYCIVSNKTRNVARRDGRTQGVDFRLKWNQEAREAFYRFFFVVLHTIISSSRTNYHTETHTHTSS